MSNIKPPSPNKNLVQHYLNNQSVIDKICSDFSGEYEGILEIGPGPATLTKTLATKDSPIILIEKELRFKELLLNIDEHITLHQQDALVLTEE